MPDIQRVMGALCFARRAGSTPYADLNTPAQWDEVAREFARQCCGLLGQVKPLRPTAHAQKLMSLLVCLSGQLWLLQCRRYRAFAWGTSCWCSVSH